MEGVEVERCGFQVHKFWDKIVTPWLARVVTFKQIGYTLW
jgi:hypothetical protein